MKKQSFFTLFLAVVAAAFLLTCNRKDKDSEPAPGALMKPISVVFSREALEGLISVASANEFAGLCFMPVEDGDRVNLRAIRAEWNTSAGKSKELVKDMSHSILGEQSNLATPALAANGTQEFELTMIDAATLQHFLNYDHFYKAEGQKASGLFLTRAMLNLPVKDQYREYRALAVRPFPEPVLEKVESRASLANYLSWPCPPLWREDE